MTWIEDRAWIKSRITEHITEAVATAVREERERLLQVADGLSNYPDRLTMRAAIRDAAREGGAPHD